MVWGPVCLRWDSLKWNPPYELEGCGAALFGGIGKGEEYVKAWCGIVVFLASCACFQIIFCLCSPKSADGLSDFITCFPTFFIVFCRPLSHSLSLLFHSLSLQHCLFQYPVLSFDADHHNLLETFYLLDFRKLCSLSYSKISQSFWLDSLQLPDYQNLSVPGQFWTFFSLCLFIYNPG